MSQIIIDHNNLSYREKRDLSVENKFNGAYYYSLEIVRNIIPRITTNRSIVTVNCGFATDGAIVFIHNNLHPERYDFLEHYNDLILVCGLPETCEKVKHLGKTIYLPLSVDVEEVKKYRKEAKNRQAAYVGRFSKLRLGIVPLGTVYLCGIQREELLKEMADFREVYAVGRTAIEAKILGCKVLPFDRRFPDPNIWEVLDNKEAAKILQQKLNDLEKGGKS